MNERVGTLDQFLMKFQLSKPRINKNLNLKEFSLNKNFVNSKKYSKTPSPVKEFYHKRKNFIMPRIRCKPTEIIKKIEKVDPLGTFEKVREELM